ncbi:MAG TPA: Crp/Fnr family transcriptional regulator [Usitatibacteraceae bacterium]|nr:Crp/Fnr family transcriptional regulator [Usitatibacteraceae bacterium]
MTTRNARAEAPFILTPEELAAISSNAPARHYPPKTIIVTEGDQAGALFVILEGSCKAYVSGEDGREAVLSVMGPGEYFGEIALDEGPRSASVMTLEPSRLLVVPQEGFQAFLAGNPDFAAHFIRKLIGRIRELTRIVGNLSLLDVYGRVARLLLDSAREEEGLLVIPERLTQIDIASRVGCSREMVSRIFKDLVQGGYVSLEKERILIHRRPPARW